MGLRDRQPAPDDLQALETFPTTSPAETLARAADFFAQNGGVSARRRRLVRPDRPARRGPHHDDAQAGLGGHRCRLGAARRARRAGRVRHRCQRGRARRAALGRRASGSTRSVTSRSARASAAACMAGGRLMHGLAPSRGRAHADPARSCARPVRGRPARFTATASRGSLAGSAIERRWGKPGEELGDRSEVWELEAEYLALGLVNVICIALAAADHPRRRRDEAAVAAAPASAPACASWSPATSSRRSSRTASTSTSSRPALGDRAGVLGAIELARLAAQAG